MDRLAEYPTNQTQSPMSKQAHIRKTMAWARAHGFDDIKANIPEDETCVPPIAYGRKDGEEAFVPDVTGESVHGMSYFEVVMKTDPMNHLISKLKLISVLAARRGGKLYLMAPKGHFQFARDVAQENQIIVELIRLD